MKVIKSNALFVDNYIKDTECDAQNEKLIDIMRKSQIELIKGLHPYKIRQLPEGRWQTYVKDDTKKSGRREIKAQTEQALYSALADIYLVGDTFEALYKDWFKNLEEQGKTGGTLVRYQQRYDKYIANSKIPQMNIKNIDISALETECNKIISKFNITYHEWQQVKTLLIKPFKYAVKKRLIPENPMNQIEINVRYKQENEQTSETQVYNTDEYNAIFDFLKRGYNETKDDSYLAIELQFYTGLRIGELVALQFRDITDEGLHIVREETRAKSHEKGNWSTDCVVVDHTKTYTTRFVDILPPAKAIFKELQEKYPNHKGTDFLFTRNGKRLRARQVEYVLEKYAEVNDLAVKSSHKVRKTYASMLEAQKVPMKQIQKELGQKHMSTTEKYIFNCRTSTETYNLMCQAFQPAQTAQAV